MIPTLDVRAAGACAPRGIRIPATALKGRRPRPLDDGGSDLHREHCIVAAAIRRSDQAAPKGSTEDAEERVQTTPQLLRQGREREHQARRHECDVGQEVARDVERAGKDVSRLFTYLEDSAAS